MFYLYSFPGSPRVHAMDMFTGMVLFIHAYKMKTNKWYRLLHENMGMEDS